MKTAFFKMYILMVLVAGWLISCSEETTTESDLTFEQKLQQALDDGIRNYGGKGISAAVIFPDGEVWQGVAGISHGNTSINTNTLFSAGSITKTFTAATILQMAAEGKINLDDSLQQWLPNYPNIDPTITIRQLLNHTSGIFNLTEHPTIWQEVFSDPDRIWDLDETVRDYTLTPYFDKGSAWHYSNTGYLLLRMIIKNISQTDIAAVYRERFFNMLEMTESYTAIDEELLQPMAHGWMNFTGDNNYDDLGDSPMNSFYSMAGGGVFCTAMDLAKWTKALFIEKSVVPQPYYDQMINFYSPTPVDPPIVDGYGLGILRFTPELVNGLEAWGHGGDAIGYAAACIYLVDYDVCFGIMDNTEEGDAMGVTNDILGIVLEGL
jgi:D-alanyl-D-alanine carboxypeptidase